MVQARGLQEVSQGNRVKPWWFLKDESTRWRSAEEMYRQRLLWGWPLAEAWVLAL